MATFDTEFRLSDTTKAVAVPLTPSVEDHRISFSSWLESMKTKLRTSMLVATAAMLAAAMIGCSARTAPGVKGRWKPINSFAEETVAIPLQDIYLFYPSPTDVTLKAMLSRWAQDANMTLSYQHPSDFTLHAPVAKIRTADLKRALSQLTEIYAEQGVVVTASGNAILAQPEPDAEGEPAPIGAGSTK